LSKGPQNGVEAEGKVSGNILEKAPAEARAKLSDDPFNIGP
jgi:hypothetical protein